MCKKAFAVAGLSMRRLKSIYIITGAVFLATLISDTISMMVSQIEGNSSISAGHMFMLLPLLAAVIVPARHTRKILNLGARRADVFNGAAPVYAILSAVAALLLLVSYYSIDRVFLSNPTYVDVFNLVEVFGFMRYGPVVAFLQMFSFLLLFSAVIHTLTAAQDKWYGWVADVVIVSIISVFTPIPVLRASLVWFFRLIIFNPYAWAQIIVCLALAVLVYMLNRPILARKII